MVKICCTEHPEEPQDLCQSSADGSQGAGEPLLTPKPCTLNLKPGKGATKGKSMRKARENKGKRLRNAGGSAVEREGEWHWEGQGKTM